MCQDFPTSNSIKISKFNYLSTHVLIITSRHLSQNDKKSKPGVSIKQKQLDTVRAAAGGDGSKTPTSFLLVLAILWVASPLCSPSSFQPCSWLPGLCFPLSYFSLPQVGVNYVLWPTRSESRWWYGSPITRASLSRDSPGEGRCCSLTQTCEIPLTPRLPGSRAQDLSTANRDMLCLAMLKATTMLLSRAGNFCWALITWQEPY